MIGIGLFCFFSGLIIGAGFVWQKYSHLPSYAGKVDVKQVIVMRKDLNMRKGKMIAQGSHASMAFLSNRLKGYPNLKLTAEMLAWLMNGSFTKVCLSVDSEEELLKVYQEAKDANLEVQLITDSGKTEFNGVPTKTCLAIGPDLSYKINSITGNLKLL